MTQFGLYPRFYVRRKDLLFPLIEQYSEQSLKGKSHGQVVQVYFNLLKTNYQFKEAVDKLIEVNAAKLMSKDDKKNACGYMNLIPGVDGDYSGSYLTGVTPAPAKTGGGGIIGNIIGTVGNIFGFAQTKAQADANSDAAFYEAVLTEQKRDDTIKVLVISGITLAFLGLGTYLVLKLRK